MNNIDIIKRAMRRIGVLGAGQLPTTEEIDDGLDALKAIYTRAISEGAFGELTDVVAPSGDFEAAEFTRVLRNDHDTTSISLPEMVLDECTGEYRTPRHRAVIAIQDDFSNQYNHYIYDGDQRSWLIIEAMTATGLAPFGAADANGLASALAVEIADEYGQPVPDNTRMAAIRFMNLVVHDWSREDAVIARPESYF